MDLLREVLQAVDSGQNQFTPESEGEVDLRQFQPAAVALDYAEQEGLLGKVESHKNARYGIWLVDAVFVMEGITHKGRLYLSGSGSSAPLERKLEDVLELRPNFMGIGINLRELFRRIFKKRTS